MFERILNAIRGSGFDEGSTPNKFTIEIGARIRKARREIKMTQQQLAKLIYKHQAAVSEIENGKLEPTAQTLFLLSYALNKPIGYFFPRRFGLVELYEEDLEEQEQELILHSRRLVHYSEEAELERLITQVRALADLAEKNA